MAALRPATAMPWSTCINDMYLLLAFFIINQSLHVVHQQLGLTKWQLCIQQLQCHGPREWDLSLINELCILQFP
jgi:hypothetical protein